MRPSEGAQADELEGQMSDEDHQLLDDLADGIARRKLAAPAIFFLESTKPLNLLGASMMIFLRPIISVVWNNPAKYDRLRVLLEHRGAMEVLLRRLEARA
ncbi:MAG: hypothetical protein KJO07_25925 [Deltaproteobacteria bacterium]|jgi:hypothetical protein|nr:hypothetical protein [Deltaproteobacteria bacterium]